MRQMELFPEIRFRFRRAKRVGIIAPCVVCKKIPIVGVFGGQGLCDACAPDIGTEDGDVRLASCG